MAIGDASLLRLPLQPLARRKIAVRTAHNTARILPLDRAPCEQFIEPVKVHPLRSWMITFGLTVLAAASAAAVALGTHPIWMQHAGGMNIITASRKWQWPLTALCLILCLTLIALVIGGKRRAAWLIMLVPVLFFFYHRFAGDPFRRMIVMDNPPYVLADQATHLKDDSLIIGVIFEGDAYAFPAGALYHAPVLTQSQADRRMLLMWSPYAGRAQAFAIDHSIKARELDIVSMPANATLVYNSRNGQFINGFTGLTTAGERPSGVKGAMDTTRTTWKHWRTAHPNTKVLATAYSPAGEKTAMRFPLPPHKSEAPGNTKVTLLSTAKPVVMQSEKVTASPLNLSAGGANLLIYRDKNDRLHVYDRAVKGDLFPKFAKKAVVRKLEIAFIDSDTQSLWTADGRCVDGYAKGEQLRAVRFEEELPLGVVRAFYAEVELVKP